MCSISFACCMFDDELSAIPPSILTDQHCSVPCQRNHIIHKNTRTKKGNNKKKTNATTFHSYTNTVQAYVTRMGCAQCACNRSSSYSLGTLHKCTECGTWKNGIQNENCCGRTRANERESMLALCSTATPSTAEDALDGRDAIDKGIST